MKRLTVASPLGTLALQIGDNGRLQRVDFAAGSSDGGSSSSRNAADKAAHQLTEFFAGTRQVFDLDYEFTEGTAFQRQVWEQIAAIPYGETLTYGEIASALGRPGASRAVGAACGQNPMSIVVPCHRVVGTGSKLTGYGGGLDRKAWLLEFEGGQRALVV